MTTENEKFSTKIVDYPRDCRGEWLNNNLRSAPTGDPLVQVELACGEFIIRYSENLNWALAPDSGQHIVEYRILTIPEVTNKAVKEPIPEAIDSLLTSPDARVSPLGIRQPSALDTQISGDHYKKLGIYQPWQVAHAQMSSEELKGYLKGTVLGYLARKKGSAADQRKDIEKAHHTLGIYLELTKDDTF